MPLRPKVNGRKAQIEPLMQHNRTLRLNVDEMVHTLFDKSSEKLDPKQLHVLFDTLPNQAPDHGAKKPTPRIRQHETRRLKRHLHPQQRFTTSARDTPLIKSSKHCECARSSSTRPKSKPRKKPGPEWVQR